MQGRLVGLFFITLVVHTYLVTAITIWNGYNQYDLQMNNNYFLYDLVVVYDHPQPPNDVQNVVWMQLILPAMVLPATPYLDVTDPGNINRFGNCQYVHSSIY